MWKKPVRLQPGFLLLILLGALLAAAPACADKSDASAPVAAAGGPAKGDRSVPSSAERAMRVTVEMSVMAADVNGAIESIRAAVREQGGYVSSARTNGEPERQSGDLELKIPVARLGDFRAAVAGAGTVLQESETAEDVTEQRADLKARVRNAHAQEKRLLDLLSDRTGSLADVIAAEKSLAEVRETIERLEAQDAVLDGQIAFATVKVHVTPMQAPAPATVSGRIFAAGARGVALLGQLAVGTAVVFATIGPSVVVLALLAYALYRVARRLGARAARPSPAIPGANVR